MAAVMVGGAILSAVFDVLVKRIAMRQVVDFFKRKKLNETLLEKLEIRLNTISGVLDDADQKQITNPFVKNWLDRLRSAAYEADDFLDEISYKALQLEVEAGSQSQSQTSSDQKPKFLSSLIPRKITSSFIPRRRRLEELERRMEDILETLDYLLQQIGHLGLEKNDGGVKSSTQKRPTTSLVDEDGVYGREHDKEAIIKLVLSNDENGKYPGVIPIVGMGGVGKTTLAQLVYYDSRVKEQFDLRAWVCVSEDMDFRKVSKDILRKIGFSNFDSMGDDDLHCKLAEELQKKRILLVLDDVWSDDQAEWESCLVPFKCLEGGSKIIVTTRSQRVASVKSTVPSYHLQQLSEDNCWSLFVQHAFGGGRSCIDQDLAVVGKELVKKCSGLPLAAKTLGSQLRFNKDVEDWEKMLRSNLWDLEDDKILPALRLSYYALPSYLKQCFAYCALFPKDYEFQKEKLILLWMAEGFLVQPNRNKELAEMGDDYFHELVSRSFFQPSTTLSSGFIMHDLMHDLAQSIHGEFCIRMENDSTCKPIKTTRHLSVFGIKMSESKEKLESLHEAQSLRTYLLEHWFERMEDEVLYNNTAGLDFALKLKCLRVLSLRFHKARELPNSIGNLKHLRYLDLSGASITALPEAVSMLYYLQTLILKHCLNLTALPNSIGKLKELKYLNLGGTLIKSLPESMSILSNLQKLILNGPKDKFSVPSTLHGDGLPRLEAMPPDIGRLTKVRELTDFVVGKQSGSGIKELGKLQQLHETVRIWNLENIEEAEGDLAANLMGMKYLQGLELHWKGIAGNSQHVLEELRPHTNVKLLLIDGFSGASFPSWVGSSSFSNIVTLHLSDCPNCSSFPPLGQLESLKDLHIIRFPRVETVDLEFYGNGTKKPFRVLESLRIEHMKQWREWLCDTDNLAGAAFPSLQVLLINNCRNLTKALPTHLPSLTMLEIYDCEKLVVFWPTFPAIVKMTTEDSSREVQLEKLPSGQYELKVLKFHAEDIQLKISEAIGGLCIAVEKLTLWNCDSLKKFPLDLFPKLRTLSIGGCPKFESFSKGVIHSEIETIEICWCYSLKCFQLELFPNLKSLHFFQCHNLESLCTPEEQLESFPALNSLRILRCRNFKSLPAFPILPSLVDLTIESWDELGCSPEERFPQIY